RRTPGDTLVPVALAQADSRLNWRARDISRGSGRGREARDRKGWDSVRVPASQGRGVRPRGRTDQLAYTSEHRPGVDVASGWTGPTTATERARKRSGSAACLGTPTTNLSGPKTESPPPYGYGFRQGACTAVASPDPSPVVGPS